MVGKSRSEVPAGFTICRRFCVPQLRSFSACLHSTPCRRKDQPQIPSLRRRQQTSTQLSEKQGIQTPSLAPRAPPAQTGLGVTETCRILTCERKRVRSVPSCFASIQRPPGLQPPRATVATRPRGQLRKSVRKQFLKNRLGIRA